MEPKPLVQLMATLMPVRNAAALGVTVIVLASFTAKVVGGKCQ